MIGYRNMTSVYLDYAHTDAHSQTRTLSAATTMQANLHLRTFVSRSFEKAESSPADITLSL